MTKFEAESVAEEAVRRIQCKLKEQGNPPLVPKKRKTRAAKPIYQDDDDELDEEDEEEEKGKRKSEKKKKKRKRKREGKPSKRN